MSLPSVRQVVDQLVADPDLAQQFHQNSEGVLGKYQLSPEEKAAIIAVGRRYGFDANALADWSQATIDWWAPPKGSQ